MGNETMKLWGVSVSYFTGKIEAYLRYKRIRSEERRVGKEC